MTRYEKGRRAEYYIKKKLEEKGYFVSRFPQSKPADLFSIKEGKAELHEVTKAGKRKDKILKFRKVCDLAGCDGYFWYKDNGKWKKFKV